MQLGEGIYLVLFGCIGLLTQNTSGAPSRGGDAKRSSSTVHNDDQYHPEFKGHADHRGDFIGSGRVYDWAAMGQQELDRALQVFNNPIVKEARNVVFFVGDGMGISTTTAARVHKAQSRQLDGEEMLLAWDTLAHAGLSMSDITNQASVTKMLHIFEFLKVSLKLAVNQVAGGRSIQVRGGNVYCMFQTYATDRLTPDSASTATAFMCGEKTGYGILGLNQNASYGICESEQGNWIKSNLHKAMDTGKATGIVTTATMTHATPAAAYSHSAARGWESNAPDGCQDIASQLIDNDVNHDIRVIMGGGRRHFMPTSESDPETGLPGTRLDERNLIEVWEENMADSGLDPEQYSYVIGQEGFDQLDPDVVSHVLGLFSYNHMRYEADRHNDTLGEPSLAEMVEKSIRILEQNEDGFFLYVEGGRIDHANHITNAYRALEDTVALSDAVAAAKAMTNPEDTLIVVTADHSHTLTIGGYPLISTSVYGYDEQMVADDLLPYTTLAYANGPGYFKHRTENGSLATEGPRKDISEFVDEFDSPQYLQDAGVPMTAETHGGEEVAIYASGPMSHLFHGVHQQSYIAHVVAYAACLEDARDDPHCTPAHARDTTSSAASQCPLSVLGHQAAWFWFTLACLVIFWNN